MRTRRCRASGAALVTALVIAALTAAAAVAMASRTQLEVARTTLQIDAARRRALVARVEATVREALREEAKRGQGEEAAAGRGDREYGARERDITASTAVRDEQRRFNLNNLAGMVRGSGSRRRSAAPAGAADDVVTGAPAARGAAPSSRSANRATRGERTPLATGELPSAPAADVAGPNEAQVPGGPEYVERTRVVLDPSVAKLIGGRGRPSELAALVALSGASRVSETYLERLEPETRDPGAGQADARDPVAANPDANPTADPGAGASPAAPGSSHPAPVAVMPAAPASTAALASRSSTAPAAAVASRPANELWVMRFSLLLKHLDIEAPVTQAILDWLDADAEVRFPNGAEDAYYLKLDHPYRAANRPFSDVSELLLVRGVTPEVYARLLPFVTVLPAETAININTAPAEVLMSLAPGIDRRTADLIITTRDVQPFRSTEALLSLPMLAMSGLDPDGLDVGSEFFAATTRLASGVDVTHSRALIARARSGRTRVARRQNGYFDD